MLRIFSMLASVVMMSAVLEQSAAQKDAPAQMLEVKYSERGGEVTVTVSGSVAMEGSIVWGKGRDGKLLVQAWTRSEAKDQYFVKTATEPSKVTLAGASLPVVSVDDGGKGFKDPGERQWTLVKGDKGLAQPKAAKEGDDPPTFRLKGTTVWTKDRPDALQLTDDSGRIWRHVAPKEEGPK